MKACQKCNYQNSDSMRFCVECGTPLAGAPIVVNLQDNAPPQPSNASAPAFDKSMETHVGSGRQNFAGNFPTVQQTRRGGGGGKKVFLIIGGVLLLFFMLFAASAAILIYNWKLKSDVVANTSPTPTATRPVEEKSPTPTATKTPSTTPSVAPSVFNSPNSTTTTTGASGKFDEMWVDFNVTEKGRSGMRIHVTFSAYNMKGVDSQLAIFFQKSDGTNLLSNSSEYRSKSGTLILKRALRPAYDNTEYKDLQLFMPYDELNLGRGTHDLKMDVDLVYENEEIVEHFNVYDFQYKEN